MSAAASVHELWRERLRRNGDGGLLKTLDNCMLIHENDPELGSLAVDEMRGCPVWTAPVPWADEQRPLLDSDFTLTRRHIARRYGVEFPKTTAIDAMIAVAWSRRFNRLKDYLESLRWDGVKRIAYWLHVLAGAEHTHYTSEAGRRWLISAVARAYKPACQADHVLVLEGKQGKGKSSLLGVLGGEWYSDVKLDPTSTWVAVELENVWIHETSEVEKLSRYDLAHIKAFITKRRDDARMPYDRNKSPRPRRCVFAASTNAAEYLSDPTGNRRWWPIRCGDERIDIDRARDVRDQLWAEAVVAFKAGEIWHFAEDELLAAAELEQQDRAETHPWFEMLAEESVGRDEWSGTEALQCVLGDEERRLTDRDFKTMASVLASLGFTESVRERRYGQRIRLFRRPSEGGPRGPRSE